MHRYKHGTEYAHMIAHTIAHYEELPDEVKSAIALGCTNLAPWKAQLLKLWPGRRREDGLSRLMSSAK